MRDLDTLLARLDLVHPGLVQMRGFMQSGAKGKALQAAIDHFRNRRSPTYLFDESDAGEFDDTEIVAEADGICRHEILGYDLGKEIDWHSNPTIEDSRDPEWMWSLFRHSFWVTLGRAYMMTKDEKYACEFIGQLEGVARLLLLN